MSNAIVRRLCIVTFAGIGLWACSQSDGGGGGGTSEGGKAGGSAAGSGGNSGGTSGPAGSTAGGGGAQAGNGGKATGGSAGGSGQAGSGGKSVTGGSTGGAAGTAGKSSGGAGGAGTAGTSASGGNGGSTRDAGAGGDAGAGTGGGGGGGGATAGSGGSGTCTKGQTKGNQVVFIGESFIQMSTIPEQVAKNAVAAGSLTQGDKYINNAVSGMTLAGNNVNSIPNQYARAAKSGTIKYVIMDGGGNDCLLNNNGDAALAAAKTLFQTMEKDKIEKVQYFFYPDPVGSNFGNLKTCLDALRPKMQALCAELTSPKCYWLDLRPTWNGHNEYTSDGIHPTSAGSVATGDAIWKEMVKNCVAQ